MNINISQPPKPNGTPEQQMKAMYRWMCELAQQLNYALYNLELNNFTEAAQQEIKKGE